MKKSILTLGLLAITAISFAQTTIETIEKGIIVEELAYSGHSNLGGNVSDALMIGGTGPDFDDIHSGAADMPIKAGISGTTNRIYLVKSETGETCVSFPTVDVFQVGEKVEVKVAGWGATSYGGSTSTCAIRKGVMAVDDSATMR